jgi:uroporphyrinogen decarboxylase
MKHRERAMQALNHQEPDRIPIDLSDTICSSITKTSYIDLKKHLGMSLEEIKVLWITSSSFLM